MWEELKTASVKKKKNKGKRRTRDKLVQAGMKSAPEQTAQKAERRNERDKLA